MTKMWCFLSSSQLPRSLRKVTIINIDYLSSSNRDKTYLYIDIHTHKGISYFGIGGYFLYNNSNINLQTQI